MKLTGTFIDEISHDIPSSNWGRKQWFEDFKAMSRVGIDTVIVIRNGYKTSVTFESETIKKTEGDIMPVPIDLLDMFLDYSEQFGMNLFFGTYDSGKYWINGDYQREVDINRAFAEEVMHKYGHYNSLKGWYISHEIDAYNPQVMKVYRELGSHLKKLKDLPVLISPYIHGKKQFAENPITLSEHEKQWDRVFAEIQDCVDIVAFQDGNVDYSELKSYLTVNSLLAAKYGLTSWTNVETFDRDVLIKFPPLPWPKLLKKIQDASASGTDKLITFEFSHFLSPNSIYPSAHNLYDRYCEWLEMSGTEKEAVIKNFAPAAEIHNGRRSRKSVDRIVS